jgi:multidrug efflux pump subunit AcrB
MEQYIEALKELNIQLKDTLAIQKELVEKLKWAVDFFHDAVLEENKKEIEVNIDNEHAEDLKADAGMIAKDLDERDDDLEKLSEEESEVLP